MLIFRGTRTARIKTYQDHSHPCVDCKNFDLTVKVYKPYFHFFFIPILPTGVKSVKIHCNSCGQPFRSDSLNKEYELKTRVPFYLSTGTILVALLILAGASISLIAQYQRSSFVANPKVGDVYRIREDSGRANTYFFVRIANINGDSVFAFDNTMRYLEPASNFDPADYFSEQEQILFTKSQLKEMLKNGTISEVERDYGQDNGFNRIKKE